MTEFDTYKTCKDCPYRYPCCHDKCDGKKYRDAKRAAYNKAKREEHQKYYIRWNK